MGSEYISRTGLNLKESYIESSARTPPVLIHPHGKPCEGSHGGSMMLISCRSVFKIFYLSMLGKELIETLY